MWKNLLVPAALLASAPALAQQDAAPTYDVTVQANARSVRLTFETIEDQSAMCALRTSFLEVDIPMIAPRTGAAVGAAIIAETELDPDTICLQAIGPHTGTIVFEKGPELPEIRHGSYHLFLDDEYYGLLRVSRGGASLIPPEGAPEPTDG